MNGKRQNIQLVLAFGEADRGEAPKSLGEGTEPFTAKRMPESPAIGEKLMEEVCERHRSGFRNSLSADSLTRRTAVYVTRMYGGVGGEGP